MSEPLHGAASLPGIWAVIGVANSSATQEETNKRAAAAAFRANAASGARLPDEGWLTDADLNILENEAHAPGRRWGGMGGLEPRRRVEKHWDGKQRAVQQRADGKMGRSKAEKQPPRRQADALYKQNRRSLPFIWISIQLRPHKRRREGRQMRLHGESRLLKKIWSPASGVGGARKSIEMWLL